MPDKKTHSKKKILLVDDHPLLRQGIWQLVDGEPDLMVCGEAEDQASALAAVRACKPDIAVIDLSLKNDRGLELIRELKVQHPQLPVLVLSMHEEALYAERALRVGARGYIMKREAAEKVLEAIRTVLSGVVYVSRKVSERILNQVSGSPKPSEHPWPDNLTDRELEVLMLIGQGHGNEQIARQLHISARTVETHRANLKLKLNLSSGADLLQHAIRWAQQAGAL